MGKIKKILENELVGGTQSTDVYPVTSIKAVYDEKNERLDHILSRRGVVNVSTNYNDDHIAETLTLSGAIAKVPSTDRTLGFVATFLTSNGWKTYQFTGDSTSDWLDINNWLGIPTDTDLHLTNSKVSSIDYRKLEGNTINLLNPTSKLEGLISSGEILTTSLSFFSYGGIKLQAGHKYRLLKKNLRNYGGSENYRLFQTSDRTYTSIPLRNELIVSEDAVNPVVYISSYRADAPEGVAPFDAENLMFVDVTNSTPNEFVPYYFDSYLDNKLSEVETRVSEVETGLPELVSGNTINLLNPSYLGDFIDSSIGSSTYLSHNPMKLEAGHKYGLYTPAKYSGALNLGTGNNLNILVTSDNYPIKRYVESSVFEVPSDMVNPKGYITNFAAKSRRVDYTSSMFVDVTDGEPTTFKPYYDNRWYANVIGDIFGHATVYSGSISIDTSNLTVTAKGRFFIDSSFRRATNSMVDVTIEETVTNIKTDTLSAIHYLVWDVQAKAFYIWRASTYNPLVMTKALVIVGFGPLDDGGSRFYSLCNELIIDGHHYTANPSSKLESLQESVESLQESVESLQESAITKSLERTENLFNYRDETYKDRTISDGGIWSTNSSFTTVAIPLEAGKTYKRYAQAGQLDSWGATNVRIFGEDGTLVLKSNSASIKVPDDAVNPIGYFAYYNSLGDYNPSLFMVLPGGVSGDEQLPYLRGSITDEDLIAFIDSKLRDVDISKSIVQTSGSSTDKVMSQTAVTNYVANKISEVVSKNVAQTTGSSTELLMSQKAVTDALAELSEQIQGEPTYRFAERPAKGYENFLVDVNCSIADNTTVSNAVQDSRDIKQDRCILSLPVNYSRSGEPVRLVICGHGTGWKCTASTTMPWAGMNTQLLLDEGYAVLGCNGTPGELDGLDQGHNCVPECYRSILAAYKYVIERYNIKRDGVLTAGLSMGTYMTGQVALFKEIPVLAQVFYGFSGEIWKAQYTLKSSVRQRMCEKFGFTGEAPTIGTSNPPSSAEQEYIKSNIDKWAGYDLLIAGLTNKAILDTFKVWVKSSTLVSEEEAAIYNDAIVVGRPPCKFFVCDDDTTSPARWSEYMAKMIRNGGGYAEVRHYATGGHNAWGVGDSIEVATKYGGTKRVNGSSYEGLLFLQKFDH